MRIQFRNYCFKRYLVFLIFLCCTSENNQLPRDSKGLILWKSQQSKLLEKQYNYENTKYKLKEQIDEKLKLLNTYPKKYNIGNYTFSIEKEGIYYKSLYKKSKHKIFAELDSIKGGPMSLLKKNYSNFLVAKNSKYSNDDYNIYIWDISSKKLIKKLKVLDYPEVQSTENYVYFSQYKEKKFFKRRLYRFSFLDHSIEEIRESSFKFSVLSNDLVLLGTGNNYTLINDKRNTRKLLRGAKNLIPLGTYKGKIFAYKEFNSRVVIYKSSPKKKDNSFKEIFSINKSIKIKNLLLEGEIVLLSIVDSGINYLYELNLLNLTFRKLDLPKHGLINFGYHDKDSVYINYTSLTTPQKIYSYEIDTKSLKIVHEVELKNKNEYVLSQKWLVREKDSIPLILFHKKGLELNGNNPLLLYGYGGFGLSIIPYYEPYIHNFVDNEGIYAVAGIRGGGEMGKEWHDKGKAMNKKESFHDFKFCLEQMVQEKYTTPKKIAIMGYSNGGLIMNNALINYPHLFNTAISINGLSDIVNYPKYDNRGYSPEYFTSNRLKSYFYIKDYSPLQNVERIENNVLVVAGDKDDRVNPLHSYKFVKALQEQNSPNVFLYNIKNAGHGTLNVKKYHEVQREIFSFILNCLTTTNEKI